MYIVWNASNKNFCMKWSFQVAMDFRHPDGRHISILLPRRSVLIMIEECRYAWTHG